MSWKFIHQFLSPKYFYRFSSMVLSWVGFLAIAILLTGLVWGLLFTPSDHLQGHSYRIIFIHVPAASLSMSIYVAMAVAGAIGFIWRIKIAFLAAKSLAVIGASFCFLAICTGAIWGKPTWGTWWIWDARLTSMLILFFLYLGPLSLQQLISNHDRADRLCALLSFIGIINLPIIKYSVEWWSTLHQGASITLKSSFISSVMLYPLLVSFVGFYLFCFFLFLLRMRIEILNTEYRSHWVQQLC